MILFVKKVGVLRNLTRNQVDSFVKNIPCDFDYIVKGKLFNEVDVDLNRSKFNRYKLIIFKKEK